MEDLSTLRTEQRNPESAALDTMPVPELLALMNAHDQLVAQAVSAALPQIAPAVDLIVASLGNGGRLIYLGAGTSGRIGLLDAVECPPTFGTDPGTVIALIAGGSSAFGVAVEGAEDRPAAAAADLEAARLSHRDTVVGLAASGRTPYVIAGLDHARSVGAATVSIACNLDAACSAHADLAIELDTGPEILTGSTRLKAGSAQKMVCNMLSTAAMVQLGKTFQNLMIDLRPTNEKLLDRAVRIVAAAADVPLSQAAVALAASGNRPKLATVMLLAGVDAANAARARDAAEGFLTRAVEQLAGAE